MRYHPLFENVWNEPKLDGCTLEQRGFAIYLFSNPRVRPCGIYRVTDQQAAADVGLSEKKTATYMADLAARRFIVRDGAWLFLPGYLARQPKQPFLLKGVGVDVMECSSIPILEAFHEKYPLLDQWSANRRATVEQWSGNGTTRAYAEQMQSRCRAEQMQSSTTVGQPLAADAAPPPPVPVIEIPPVILDRVPSLARWPSVESLVDLWNDSATRHGYPHVESLSPARRAKAKAAMRTFPDWRFWNGAFSHIRHSRFLLGHAPPTNGHTAAFRADFDWFLAKGKDGIENAVKVNEGRYDDPEHRT